MFRQMEKLIELLNEYEPYIASDGEHRDNFWYFIYKWWSAIFPKEIWMLKIISKEYWFIKWLVENEKIEWNNKDIAIKEWILWKSIDNYHSLLMALAIQDEPINLLISILK